MYTIMVGNHHHLRSAGPAHAYDRVTRHVDRWPPLVRTAVLLAACLAFWIALALWLLG